jgi:hypothetical protein
MGLFWDLYQLRRVNDVEATAGEAREGFQQQQSAVRDLTRQVERLTTVVIALAEILRDRYGIPIELIEAKIQEVEHRWAIPRPKTKRCGECGLVSSAARTNCMYCGKPLVSEPFFPVGDRGTEQEERRGEKGDQESIKAG